MSTPGPILNTKASNKQVLLDRIKNFFFSSLSHTSPFFSEENASNKLLNLPEENLLVVRQQWSVTRISELVLLII